MTGSGPAAATEIPRRSATGPAPLSFGQEVLWLADRALPGTAAWNVARAFRVRGPLDVTALGRAFDALAARHEALRTVFAAGGEGACQLIRPAAGVPIRHVDLRELPPASRLAEAERIASEDERTPFDLGVDMPLRVILAELDTDDRLLSITTHHIVSDGWSKNVMFRDLSVLYEAFRRGVEAALPPLPIQFADYATWERSPAHQATLSEPLAYWRAQLRDLPPPLELPARPLRRAAGFAARRTVMVLPRALAERIAEQARENGVTTYMLLLAAYAALLHRYSGSNDVVIGSPIAGRAQSETEALIGYFANTLVLRTRFEDDPTFSQLLARVRETCLDAYDHQDVPVEQLVLELQKDGRLATAPLFNAVLTMEDVLDDDLRFGDAVLHQIERESGLSKFDLTLFAGNDPDGLRLALWYRTDVFADATAERLLRHLGRLLEAALDDPERRISTMPMLAEAEARAQTHAEPAGTRHDARPLHERFRAVAARFPERTALVSGRDTLAYGELARRAAALAQVLRAQGVGPGSIVGLALERSLSAIVGMLAILEAGAAYVPLAPELPAARLAAQIAEAAVRVVIADSVQRAALPAAGIALVLADEAVPPASDVANVPAGLDDLAYVIFTSGSTGVPKGVAVTHRNVAAYVDAICERLQIPAGEPLHFATVSSLAADLGNTAIFPSLCTGGTLHLVPPDVATQPALFAEWSATQPVDLLKITPSHLGALLDGAGAELRLPRRWLVVGGEACSWQLAQRVRRDAACRMFNHYGPTETTVGACTYEISDTPEEDVAATVPIGSPLDGVRCYVRGRHGELVPTGVAGELFIGGAGVARGYVNRPDLTAERFSPDPFAGDAAARVYRTGDRVRRLPGGELEFLGRLDGQRKIRGYRVELGEIEAVLAQQPGVARAAVVSRGEAGNERLIAYAVLAGDRSPHAAETLRTALAAQLPEYMVPGAVVLMDRFPLTANGKLDRAALPAPDDADAAGTAVAPRTPTEATIAAIFAGVLKSGPVSVTADFVSLGFHSILAIRALGTLAKTLGIRIPLKTFFDAPTVERLAVVVDAERARKARTELEAALALAEGLSDVDLARLSSADARSDGSA